MKSSKDEILAFVFEDLPDNDDPSEPKSTITNTNQHCKSFNPTSNDAFTTKKSGSFSDSTENLWLQSEINGKLSSCVNIRV